MEGMSKLYVPPVMSNSELVCFLNGDKEKIQTNFLNGQPENLMIGSPLISDISAEFSLNSGYLQTDIPESAYMTLIALVKVDPTASQMFISTYGQDNETYGASLYSDQSGVKFAATRKTDNGGVSSYAINFPHSKDDKDWRIICGVASVASSQMGDYTNNYHSKYNDRPPRVVSKNAKFLIGSSKSPTYGGVSNMMSAVIYSGALTDVEINLWVYRLRAYAKSKGIDV